MPPLQKFVSLILGFSTVSFASAVYASSEKILHTFSGGTDGGNPLGSLYLDTDGSLYGAVSRGTGISYGAIFKFSADGTETLYPFAGGSDGSFPQGSLTKDARGNFFGTSGSSNGDGAIFEFAQDGTHKVLYSFSGDDGDGPNPGLVIDKKGNLYGTTIEGGSDGCGVVFKVTPKGEGVVLHTFTDGEADGCGPQAGLSIDKHGNLYGTTSSGGKDSDGTIFKVTPDGTETLLYSFNNRAKGGVPDSRLTLGPNGNLYGTTSSGGTVHDYGAVFKISSKGKLDVIYRFKGGNDGDQPRSGVTFGNGGSIYGVTYGGGTTGYGTAYSISADGKEQVLHSFGAKTDGRIPKCDLAIDGAGNLYGVTFYGGSKRDQGVLFELTN